MEQPSNLDQLFRERLQGAELPPPAFVWPNVERELRRRRRRLFLWLWFGLGLAGAGLWALRPTGTTAMPPSENTTLITPLEQAHPTDDLVHARATRDEDFQRTAQSLAEKAHIPYRDSRSVQSKSGRNLKISVPPLAFSQKSVARTLPANAASGTISGSRQSTDVFISSGLFPTNHVLIIPGLENKLLSSRLVPVRLPSARPFITRKKDPKHCYDFNKHGQAWLFDVYAGPSWPQRRLEAAQPVFDDYLGQRRNSERAAWAFNGGLRGSLLFSRHFLLRTGLHYEQMTEVFEYIDPNYIEVTTRQQQVIIDNMVKTVLDTISIEYGENYVKSYNRFGRLDIPLLAGVELRAGRLGISLQGGASLNVLFWKRGTILGQQGLPQRFTPGARNSTPVFRQHLGFSTVASAQIFGHLRPRLRVFAEPFYSRTFQPVTLDNQPVQQRYTLWGLKVGLTKIID